jgi:adenine/guanine phosphoribosyltransferase-like PRPP-binding protein
MPTDHVPNYSRTVTHLKEFIQPREAKKIVAKCVRLLEKSGLEFTTIAFRGLSGALIAPAIALEMDKTLLAVRKQKTDHGSYPVEGDHNAKNYVIVDDFIATGNTVDTIMEKIAEHIPHAKCVAVLQAYYFNHEDFAEYHSWPEILCTRYAENWNARRAIQDKEKAQRELTQREAETKVREEQIAMVSRSMAPRYEWDCNKENSWTPMPNWDEYDSSSLRAMGMPPLAPKKYTGQSRRNHLAVEAKRLSMLEQDRANFNVRMYGQQRKPQLSLAPRGVSR